MPSTTPKAPKVDSNMLNEWLPLPSSQVSFCYPQRWVIQLRHLQIRMLVGLLELAADEC